MKKTEKILDKINLDILLKKYVAVTGMGCISAIGRNIQENWDSLSSNKSGIGPIDILDTQHKNLLVAEIKLENSDLRALCNLGNEDLYTRTELLSVHAIQELMGKVHLTQEMLADTAFINSTTVGGMDTTEKYYHEFLESEENRHFIPHNSTGYGSDLVANILGINGFRTTISTACSSAANAIMLGARMIQDGLVDRVIVGGVDSLSKFTVNGFNSLRIYSDQYCKPFDENRNGLNLGEAAAYLLLESENSLKETQNTPIAYVAGYGNANDAFHQTASSDDGNGSYLAMKKALDIAQIQANEIDYINAHGTATPNNDLSESRSMIRLFGAAENIPVFSSTKAFTGHTLAAAGAIEAVFSILAIQNEAIFANLNFKNPIEDTGLIPHVTFKDKSPLKYVLSNSLGFGGNCSALIFSKNSN